MELSRILCICVVYTASTLVVFSKIIEFEKGGIAGMGQTSAGGHQGSNADDDGVSHLPLSSLFSQSDKYKCLIEGNRELCTQDDLNYMKKKFGAKEMSSANAAGNVNTENSGIGKGYNNNDVGADGHEEGAKRRYFGPRYQPIHLALQKREIKKVGHEEILSVNGRTMTIKTLSQLPYVFEVTNFLSENETELIVEMASSKTMKPRMSREAHVYLQEEIDQRLFDRWDVDFNGFISHEELTNSKELETLVLSQKDIADLLATADSDADGALSFGELSKGGLIRMKESLHRREKERSEHRSAGIQETWLWHDEDELMMYEGLLEDYHQRISAITDLPEELIERSEPLQVTKQDNSSYTACHQDSEPTDEQKPCCAFGSQNCRVCRYLSIHMFLNDDHSGGELVFPIADNETFTWQLLNHDLLKKCEKTPNKETSNIVVKPKRGNAVFWYNHEVNPYTGWMGQLEARAISGVTEISTTTNATQSAAWTAKMWVNIIGDGVYMLKPWRLGSNWLKPPNTRKEIIEHMRNDYYREGELYLHQHRKSYRREFHYEHTSHNKIENKTIEDSTTSNNTVKINSTNVSSETTNSTTKRDENNKSEKSKQPFDFDLRPNKNNNKLNEKNTDHPSTKEVDVNKNLKKDDENSVDHNNLENTSKDSPLLNSLKGAEKMTMPIGPISHIPILGVPNIHSEVPLGPPKRPLDPEPFQGNKVIDNGLLKASLLLLEELERDELEIVARSIHDKLQLACIPLIINPIR